MEKSIKKKNTTRRHLEMALVETATRLNQLGTTMGATLSRSKPLKLFAKRYERHLEDAQGQIKGIQKVYDEISKELEEIEKKEKWSDTDKQFEENKNAK